MITSLIALGLWVLCFAICFWAIFGSPEGRRKSDWNVWEDVLFLFIISPILLAAALICAACETVLGIPLVSGKRA